MAIIMEAESKVADTQKAGCRYHCNKMPAINAGSSFRKGVLPKNMVSDDDMAMVLHEVMKNAE